MSTSVIYSCVMLSFNVRMSCRIQKNWFLLNFHWVVKIINKKSWSTILSSKRVSNYEQLNRSCYIDLFYRKQKKCFQPRWLLEKSLLSVCNRMSWVVKVHPVEIFFIRRSWGRKSESLQTSFKQSNRTILVSLEKFSFGVGTSEFRKSVANKYKYSA